MAITFSFLDVNQFTAARTLLIEATTYILLSLILSAAIDIWDTHRLSRGDKLKLTGFTTRKVLKSLVDITLIVAAVTSELRTDVVLIRTSSFDPGLISNEADLASSFLAPTNGSEALLRRLDRSLTGRVGLCEWRTTVADATENWSVFQGVGYPTAVKLADSFRDGVVDKPKSYCSAKERESIVKYQLGNDAILVAQGTLRARNFTWASPGRHVQNGDTNSAAVDVQLDIGNVTTHAPADLICTSYIDPNATATDDAIETRNVLESIAKLRIRGMQCGGLMGMEDGLQKLLMFHLSWNSEFEDNDSVAITENFVTMLTDQSLSPAEVYLASRSLTPGFLTYQRSMRRGLTVVMADRFAQDVVEGTYQVCGGGCDGFFVESGSKLSAHTDFLIEIGMVGLVIVAGLGTLFMKMFWRRRGDLVVMSPVERVIATHIDGRGVRVLDGTQYLSVERRKKVEEGGKRDAGISCQIGPL